MISMALFEQKIAKEAKKNKKLKMENEKSQCRCFSFFIFEFSFCFFAIFAIFCSKFSDQAVADLVFAYGGIIHVRPCSTSILEKE